MRKIFNLKDCIQKEADIESRIKCQIFSDPDEKNRLYFTTAPKIPEIKEIRVEEYKPGWMNFFLQLRP